MTSVIQCLTNSGPGGAQQLVFQLVSTLRHSEPEMRQTVVLPPGGVFVERFKALGTPVIEMPLDRLSPATVVRMRSLLRPGAFDVVHSHGKGAGMYARLFSPGGTGVCRIHSFHGIHPPPQLLARHAYLALERRLAGRTSRFVAVGPGEVREICEVTGAAPERVRLIPNVVDCTFVRAAAEGTLPKPLAEHLDRTAGGFVVSMIARRDPLKNHALAFKAVALALERISSLNIVFAGLPEDDAEFAALKGRFPRQAYAITAVETAAPLIKRSDAILLTSRKEAGPLVVLEALCLGRPVVATDVPGIREQLVHRRTGLLCAETPSAIADALAELAGNPQVYRSMQEQAARAGSAMDVHAWAAQYVGLYAGGVAA